MSDVCPTCNSTFRNLQNRFERKDTQILARARRNTLETLDLTYQDQTASYASTLGLALSGSLSEQKKKKKPGAVAKKDHTEQKCTTKIKNHPAGSFFVDEKLIFAFK